MKNGTKRYGMGTVIRAESKHRGGGVCKVPRVLQIKRQHLPTTAAHPISIPDRKKHRQLTYRPRQLLADAF